MHTHSALSGQPGLLFPGAVKGSMVNERLFDLPSSPRPLYCTPTAAGQHSPSGSARPAAACTHRASGARRQKAKTVDCMGLVSPNDFQAFKHFYKWFQENHSGNGLLSELGEGRSFAFVLSVQPNWTKKRRGMG